MEQISTVVGDMSISVAYVMPVIYIPRINLYAERVRRTGASSNVIPAWLLATRYVFIFYLASIIPYDHSVLLSSYNFV